MCVEQAQLRSLVIELRQQAHYYRGLHARAVEREAAARAEVQRLKQIVRDQQAQIAELTQQLEALGAKVAWLQQQVFGRKSEQAPGIADQTRGKESASEALETSPPQRRRRGKQVGTKGYGRKRRDHLPTEEVLHDLPQSKQCCPRCGKPFAVFPGTEDSEVIDWEVRLVRRTHKRTRCQPCLLQTFVERDRFRGTCYRAANWIHVGQTQGRGKLDRHHHSLSTIKDIYLYPLHQGFRRRLCPSADHDD